jgi:hypothetical protein
LNHRKIKEDIAESLPAPFHCSDLPPQVDLEDEDGEGDPAEDQDGDGAKPQVELATVDWITEWTTEWTN